MRSRPIRQQVVAIVGAASGIGRETARRFASSGTRLVIADNDEVGLRSLADEITLAGGNAVPVVADVADFEAVQGVAQETERVYGRLDTWVQIAGILLTARFQDTTLDEFRRIIDVNLMGEVHGVKAALPLLVRSGGGTIICVSSIEARRAMPLHSAYAASKHAIDAFLEALRVELRHDRIPVQITQILPSTINTPLFEKGKSKIGYQPWGVPPIYSPATVAKAILHAAEHPQRDIVVGGAGKMLLSTQRLSPPILDAILARIGYAAQHTSEHRGPDAPNNLFGPVNQYNRAEGKFTDKSFPHSLSTWLDLHPTAKVAATVGAAAGLGVLLSRVSERNGQPAASSRQPAGSPGNRH